ncbi:uncharacterized protein BJX67DRAFT_356838 [Aspergillus lucknowensis]|uniref:Uncharacterized protein n=1 Tax=Aspergillus lucknowensis TaxID=176173 RepID=A0ABR4LN47_9EURO
MKRKMRELSCVRWTLWLCGREFLQAAASGDGLQGFGITVKAACTERIIVLGNKKGSRIWKGQLYNPQLVVYRPSRRWSHDYRPMPYDGGYLPIEAVERAVLKTGFRGWFSMEIFDGGQDGRGKSYELGEFATRERGSMARFIQSFSSQI